MDTGRGRYAEHAGEFRSAIRHSTTPEVAVCIVARCVRERVCEFYDEKEKGERAKNTWKRGRTSQTPKAESQPERKAKGPGTERRKPTYEAESARVESGGKHA